MRTPTIDIDWQVFREIAYRSNHAHYTAANYWSHCLCTAPPLELDAQTILLPHLYGYVPFDGNLRTELRYTRQEIPRFALYCARSAEHQRFLREELATALRSRVPHVLVLDANAGLFSELEVAAGPRPLALLPARINEIMGSACVPSNAFAGLEDGAPALAEFSAAEVEAAPLRLWEAYLLRGHAWRYELVHGEVPLVTDLRSPAAAQRSLQQCTEDAAVLYQAPPTPEDEWTRVGPLRLRCRGSLLELRLRLSSADRRLVFTPTVHGVEDARPSLSGVLTACGEVGRTDLRGAHTLCTVLCRDQEEQDRLSQSLQESLRALAQQLQDAPAEDEERPTTWLLGREGLMIHLWVPVQRQGHLPWRVLSAGAPFDPTASRAAPLVKCSVAQLLTAALRGTNTIEYLPGEDKLRILKEPNLTVSGSLGAALTAPTQQLLDLRRVLDDLILLHQVSLRREARALLPRLNEEQVAGLCVHLLRHKKWPTRWP